MADGEGGGSLHELSIRSTTKIGFTEEVPRVGAEARRDLQQKMGPHWPRPLNHIVKKLGKGPYFGDLSLIAVFV